MFVFFEILIFGRVENVDMGIWPFEQFLFFSKRASPSVVIETRRVVKKGEKLNWGNG